MYIIKLIPKALIGYKMYPNGGVLNLFNRTIVTTKETTNNRNNSPKLYIFNKNSKSFSYTPDNVNGGILRWYPTSEKEYLKAYTNITNNLPGYYIGSPENPLQLDNIDIYPKSYKKISYYKNNKNYSNL